MLQGIFNYDNPVWRFIGKLGDLILLNILWFICSIPVFTIGASTTAVYYVTLKLTRDEEDATIRSFFGSFKSNFVQATLIWLILMAVGFVLGVDYWFFSTGQMSVSPTLGSVLTAVSGALLILFAFTLTYVFPLQARFYNSIRRTLFNALFMSIRHLLYTIAMIVIDGALVVGAVFSFLFLPQIFIFFVLFGMPAIAFVNSFIFNTIFKKYMKEEEEEERHPESTPMLGEEDDDMKEAIENLKGK